jgi:integrase
MDGADSVPIPARGGSMMLTAEAAKNLRVSERPKTFYDSKFTGFGLTCRPPSGRHPYGSKSWIYEYRPGGGGRKVPTRRLKLGNYPELDAAEARKLARIAIKAVLNGADPAATLIETRAAPTIEELVGDVRKPAECVAEIVLGDPRAAIIVQPLPRNLRAPAILAELNKRGLRTAGATGYHAKGSINRKSRSLELAASYWRIHILPEIGSKKLRDVTHADVIRLHGKIGEKHRATANRCVSLLRHFYNWAFKMEYVPGGSNPARGVEMFKESGCERYLTQDELQALSAAIIAAETVGIPWPEPKGVPSKHRARREENRRSWIEPSAAAAIRLLVLTGARLREILHLRWTEIDFQRGILLLPDSKTGRKTIVLNAAALAVLNGLRASANANGKYVIPGAHPDTPRSDLIRPWALVCRAAGLSGVRLHDLRHTYASIGASGGLGLPMIGRLLGHADARTTERYAHLANDASRRATDLIAAEIVLAMRGRASAGTGTAADG